MRIRINESLTYSKKVRKRMKKQPVIKDETNRKIGRQSCGRVSTRNVPFLGYLCIFQSLVSSHLSLLAYLPEGILLTLVGLYALLRRISLGVDVRDMVREENGQSDLAVESSLLSSLWALISLVSEKIWPAYSAFCICSSWLLQCYCLCLEA